MSALGAGVRSEGRNAAVSAIGSTGVHLLAKPVSEVMLNSERTGYVIALPIPGIVTQVQTNMGATINLDWLLQTGADLIGEFGAQVGLNDMPVPFFANTAEDREVLLSQRGVSEVFHLARDAALKVVGIGTVDRQAHLVRTGMQTSGRIGWTGGLPNSVISAPATNVRPAPVTTIASTLASSRAAMTFSMMPLRTP